MKLDILVFAAHPDDAELSCAGTIIKHADMGYAIGIIDLTQGEMGTRGTIEIRKQESDNAAKILGVKVRENLKFRDGWFKDDEEHRLKIIEKIREYQPDIVLANAIDDRHPDHARAAKLVKEAAWLAGLSKIETKSNGKPQTFWRPKHVYHYLQYNVIKPDFVVDISGYADRKMEAIAAYKSQFFNLESNYSNTFISKPEFLAHLRSRIIMEGNYAHIDEAEGFTSSYSPAVKNFFDLI
jgi:bacillithiol biosynthesis deacetylase BshB1